MKKTLFIFTLLCFLCSCKNDKKKATVHDNDTTTASDLTVKKEIEIDDSLIVPEGIASFLENKMPGYSIVSKDKWLAEDYLDGMSASLRPLYNEDILAEGDFNGDGKKDFATFLEDKNGDVSLYAFHQTSDGNYKKYLLQKQGKSPFLGAGLDVEEPGFVYGGNKEVGLEYNGINYNIYEKTGKTFYYDAGRYREVLTSD